MGVCGILYTCVHVCVGMCGHMLRVHVCMCMCILFKWSLIALASPLAHSFLTFWRTFLFARVICTADWMEAAARLVILSKLSILILISLPFSSQGSKYLLFCHY